MISILIYVKTSQHNGQILDIKNPVAVLHNGTLYVLRTGQNYANLALALALTIPVQLVLLDYFSYASHLRYIVALLFQLVS